MTRSAAQTIDSGVLAGLMFCAALVLLSGKLAAEGHSEVADEQSHSEADEVLRLLTDPWSPAAFAIQHHSEHGNWPSEGAFLESPDLTEFCSKMEIPTPSFCTVEILRSSGVSLEMQYALSSFRFINRLFDEESDSKEDDCSISVTASITHAERPDDESYEAELVTLPVRSGIGLSREIGGVTRLEGSCKQQQQCDFRLELVPSG